MQARLIHYKMCTSKGVMQMTDTAYASGPRGRSWVLRLLVCALTVLLGVQASWAIAILYGLLAFSLLLVAERGRIA